MSDPISVVTQFLDAANQGRDSFNQAVRRFFTPDTVWENVGMATTTGPDEALGLLASMGAGDHSLRIETTAIAQQGDTVLTERIDYMVDAAGKTTMEIRVMGAFEIDADGKIRRWSDYFDTAPFKPK